MKYTDEQKEHIIHCFDSFCKTVIRYKAYNLHDIHKRDNARYISFESIAGGHISECGECDIYPVLQYHFEAFGYVFSVNDSRLGKALAQLDKKKRDIILMYYFGGMNLSQISRELYKAHSSISYIHVCALRQLRRIMEADGEKI